MRPAVLIGVLVALLALQPLGEADPIGSRADAGASPPSRDWEDEDRSHDRARRAAERGEILPLSTIYERALAELPGRVLEAELEREHGRWVYELKILDPRGRLLEVYVDAQSGRVLGEKRDD